MSLESSLLPSCVQNERGGQFFYTSMRHLRPLRSIFSVYSEDGNMFSQVSFVAS